PNLGPGFRVDRIDFAAGGNVLALCAATRRNAAADAALYLVGDALLKSEYVVKLTADLIVPDLNRILRPNEADLHLHLVANMLDATIEQIICTHLSVVRSRVQ